MSLKGWTPGYLIDQAIKANQVANAKALREYTRSLLEKEKETASGGDEDTKEDVEDVENG